MPVCLVSLLVQEGLPNRVGPNPGETGSGRSGGIWGHGGWGYAGVTPSGLADRSEGVWPMEVRGWACWAPSIKVRDLAGPGWPRPVDKREGLGGLGQPRLKTLSASPVAIEIDPLVPEVAVPVVSAMLPLEPALPELAV